MGWEDSSLVSIIRRVEPPIYFMYRWSISVKTVAGEIAESTILICFRFQPTMEKSIPNYCDVS